MKKRILAAVLWFYALWCVGAAAQAFAGIPEAIGIVAGLGTAAVLLAPAIEARRLQRAPVSAETPTRSPIRDSI